MQKKHREYFFKISVATLIVIFACSHSVQCIFDIFSQLLFIISFQDLAAGKMFSEEAAQIYDRATTTFLKTNMLLHFAYADFEEVTFIIIYTYLFNYQF